MANEFVVRNGLLALDNSVISGSLTVTGGITGSFSGTGSYAAFALSSSNSLTSSFAFQAANASNAVSASFATVAANASSASYALSSSFAFQSANAASASSATNAVTASHAVNAVTASRALQANTASYVQNAASASYAFSSSYALNASTATSASFASNASTAASASFATNASTAASASYATNAGTAGSASFAQTSSFVNTLNQSVIVTNVLAVGTPSITGTENTLVVGTLSTAGTGEGGQILLVASGGLYTSASMLDNYQNRFRILRGTNAGSDAEIANFGMHNGLIQFNRYTGSGAFTGTPTAFLAVDASGVVLTSNLIPSASYALSSSYAMSASFANQSANASSASYALNASTATSASYSNFAISSSFASNAANASSASAATFASTASLAQSLTPGTVVSASNIFVNSNLTVNGTASFSYLQTVSGSAVVIGEEYIVLNTQSPISRFAGLIINDSGSNSTASIVWDSQNNHFVYTNASGSTYSGGGFMSGPRNLGALGSEAYPTLNRVLRGQGGDHLYDSNITDNDTNIILGINTQITGTLGVTGTITGNLTGTASFATSASYAGAASNATSASFATSAANATTASHAVNAVTASRALNANTASFATLAANASSASYSTNAGFAGSASFATQAANATTASHAVNAVTASFALNSQNAFVQGGNSFGTTALLGTNDAQSLQFETNGVVAMTILSGGNVGLATSSPLTKLHISGTNPHVLISGNFNTASADHSRIYFNDYNFGIGAGKWTSGEGGTDDDLYLWSFNGTGRDIRFAVTTDGSTSVTSSNWTTNMIIKSSTGNVGIGTLTPATRVHNVGYFTSDVGGNGVEGGYYLGNSAHGLRRPGGASNDVYLYTTNGSIYVGTTGASSQQIVLLNNGNVGIGTTAPNGVLQVIANNSYSRFFSNNASGYTYVSIGRTSSELEFGVAAATDQFFTGTAAGDGAIKANGSSNKIHLGYSSGAPAMTINASNNVGIGTTIPLAKLAVGNGSLADTNVPFQISSTGNTTQAFIGINKNGGYGLLVGYNETTGSLAGIGAYIRQVSTDPLHFAINNTTTAMTILSDSNVGIGSTSPAYKLDVTGIIRATSYFVSAPNTTIAGGGPYDWIYLGAADTNALRASAVQIGDVAGAKYAIMGGSYDLTFAKHVSSSNTWASAFVIQGNGADNSGPDVTFNNNVGIGSNLPTYKLEVVGTARISNNTIISGSKIGFENSAAGAVFGATTISNTQSTTGVTIGRYLGDYAFIDIAAQNANGGWIDFSSGSGDDYQGRIRYNNGLQSMYFYTNANSTPLVSYTGASVGIGTSTPLAALHVAGNSGVSAPSGSGVFIGVDNEYGNIQLNGNNGSFIDFSSTGTDYRGRIIYFNSSNSMQIYTNGSTKLTINSDGNVGINSTVPAYTLDVNGPLRVNDTIYFRGTLIDEAANETAYTWLRVQPSSGDKAGVLQVGPSGTSRAGGVIELFPSSSFNTNLRHVIQNSGSNALLKIGGDAGALPIQFMSAGSATVTILSNGNVGIGETNPTSVLFTKNAGITAQNTYLGTGQLRVGGGSDHGANTVLSVAPGVVVVDAPGIVGGRFVIDSSGNIGINSPSPSYKLDVAGTVRVTGVNPSFRTDSTTDYTSLASYKSGNRIWQLDSVGSEFRVYYDAASAYMFTMSGSRGWIGIGTTIPQQELHVYSATENADVRLMGGGQSSVYLDVYYGSSGGGLFGYGSQDITIGQSGTGNYVYFKPGGSVGIGTSAPEQRLHVAGQLILKSSGEGGPYIYRDGDNAGDVRFYSTNGTFAAPTAKSSTGLLGQIHYAGYDGSSYITTAQIWASVDGAVSTNVVPSRLEFKTAATNTPSVQMVIKSNGNVGIGSSLPAFRLDVNGGIRTNGSDILLRNSDTDSSNIQIGNMATQYPYKRVDSFSHDGTGYFWGFGRRTGATQQINAFWVGSTRDFNIADGLNIIGWTANEFNGSYPSYVTNARIAGSGVSYFNGGNVGIGQTTAPHKLVINGDSTVADATANNAAVNIISSTTNRTAIRFHQYGQVEYTIGVDTHSTSGNFRIVNTNGPINLTGSSLGFIMNSSGCIGIGTVPSSQRFHVIGAVVGGATATAGSPNTTGVTTQLAFEARSTSAGNEPSISYHKEGVYTMYLQGQNSGRGLRLYSPSSETTANFYCQGDVVAYNSSDKRLKDNLIPIPNAIEKVSKLGGYSFDWNDKQDVYKGHDYGVVAQEVEEVFPELVETRQDGYKAVKYDKLTAVLIEAIKEQQKQIDELKYLLQTQNK